VIVEIVPSEVRSVVLGLFLFGMNNIGGNLPVVVDPVAEKYNYRTALLIFFPGFVGASEFFYLCNLFVRFSVKSFKA